MILTCSSSESRAKLTSILFRLEEPGWVSADYQDQKYKISSLVCGDKYWKDRLIDWGTVHTWPSWPASLSVTMSFLGGRFEVVLVWDRLGFLFFWPRGFESDWDASISPSDSVAIQVPPRFPFWTVFLVTLFWPRWTWDEISESDHTDFQESEGGIAIGYWRRRGVTRVLVRRGGSGVGGDGESGRQDETGEVCLCGTEEGIVMKWDGLVYEVIKRLWNGGRNTF